MSPNLFGPQVTFHYLLGLTLLLQGKSREEGEEEEEQLCMKDCPEKQSEGEKGTDFPTLEGNH